MQHVLDNPVWHALIGPHAEYAIGQGLARHYPRDMAPFVAIADAASGVRLGFRERARLWVIWRRLVARAR